MATTTTNWRVTLTVDGRDLGAYEREARRPWTAAVQVLQFALKYADPADALTVRVEPAQAPPRVEGMPINPFSRRGERYLAEVAREPKYGYGAIVRYAGRRYEVLTVNTNLIAGPHYRLRALGDYPGEDWTSELLISPAADEKDEQSDERSER